MASCLRGCVFLLCCLFLSTAVHAARPQSWTFSTQKDFSEGKFENVVVNSYGELSLGRTLTPIPTDTAAESVQGFTQTPNNAIYVASSPQAKIYRLDNTKSSVLFTAPQGFDDITTLSSDAQGNLLIALSGESAKLIRLNPATPANPSTLFEDTTVNYIWAILPAPDGSLYLGTGPHGKIYKLTPGANPPAPTVILETREKNITALAFDKFGNLIAGTDQDGLIIRIDPKTNKPFVLFDAGKVDVNALATDSAGNIYAATAKATPQDQEPEQMGSGEESPPKGKPAAVPAPDPVEPPPLPPPSAPDDKTVGPQGAAPFVRDFYPPILASVPPALPPELLALLKKSSASSTKPSPPTHPKSHSLALHMGGRSAHSLASDSGEMPDTGGVYRISPEGVTTTLVQNDSQNFSLLMLQNELLIGTGDEGKLFSYRFADESLTLIARVKEQQISSLFADKAGDIFLGTGNMAQVYQMGATLASTGTFTSQVLDASHTAFFGHVTLDQSLPDNSKITLSTRSGNTREVDAASALWSDWSDLPADGKINSPQARYFQFRITVAGSSSSSPVIHSLRIPFQSQNLPPVLKNVTIELPDISPSPPVNLNPDDTPDAADLTQDANLITKPAHIAWDATDPNNDTLIFRLYYQPITSDSKEPWTLFAKELKDSEYDWDTRSLPDGHYQIKVVASDSPDNPASEAREVARVSAPFLINHTPPVISDVAGALDGNKATVTGNAKDPLAAISDVRYQIDGQGDWQPAAASDKIFDSPQEGFTLVTRPLSAGPHRITVRATDVTGNSSYQAITIAVRP